MNEDVKRWDYEMQLYWRTVRDLGRKILEHPDDWDISECGCGCPVTTIPSGEPVLCNQCRRNAE